VLPCSPIWVSPLFAINPNPFDYPVVLSPDRVLISEGGFGGSAEILDAHTGTPIWIGSIVSPDFVGNASATSTQFFQQDRFGRVFVESTSDCTDAGSPPTCHPSKVFSPVTAQQNVIFFSPPKIAGQLLVTQTKGAVSFYDVGCTGTGIDPTTQLPSCDPLVIIPEDVSGMSISDGVVYVTTPTLIERWTVA
jgi:hypothetical protein